MPTFSKRIEGARGQGEKKNPVSKREKERKKKKKKKAARKSICH
jgi:hypothetical protein